MHRIGRYVNQKVILFFILILFHQVYNMADTIMVETCLGMKALAGIGSTASINLMIVGVFLVMRSSFAIPVAWKFGEKNEKALRRFVSNIVWLALIFPQ